MKNDGGCDFRELESGYCVNTGKVMAANKNICSTTCDKCYYGDTTGGETDANANNPYR